MRSFIILVTFAVLAMAANVAHTEPTTTSPILLKYAQKIDEASDKLQSYVDSYAQIGGQDESMVSHYFQTVEELHNSIVGSAVDELDSYGPRAYLENLLRAYNRFEAMIADELNKLESDLSDEMSSSDQFNSDIQQVMSMIWERKADIAEDLGAQMRTAA